MQRLFAGTPWDRPPTCETCGKPAAECACPPAQVAPLRLDRSSQTARIRLEKRANGKLVTVVSDLDPEGNDLETLAAQLKQRCGTGGTVKQGQIEVQGDQRELVEAILIEVGYKTKRVSGNR